MVTITEELFLLSLREKKNHVELASSMALPYALAGAILMELVFNGKVQIGQDGKVLLLDPVPMGSAIIDETLAKMQDKDHPKKLTYWINVFGSHTKKLKKLLTASLISQGILKEEEERYLWVIPYIAYTQKDASAKFTRKQQLRAIVLGGEKPDQQSIALLSLMHACGMLDHLFTRDEIVSATKRVDTLVKDEAVGLAVIELMDDISSAAAAAALSASS